MEMEEVMVAMADKQEMEELVAIPPLLANIFEIFNGSTFLFDVYIFMTQVYYIKQTSQNAETSIRLSNYYFIMKQ